ncbi:OmpW/AlkL family protein [Sneathiella limimaris]|uniref:OmpW/AlkL family protein n=1 Tax=Sneathiella limimaris TaxID=1964213 RepID=UPI00146D6309|nr:OmpW family protein [Sneathiella limimaris]
MKKATMLSLLAGTALALTSLTQPVLAKDAGDLLMRVRGIAVIPNEGGSTDAIGGQVDIGDAYMPELDFTYFFTENIAAELILATANHNVKVKDTSLSRDVDLGDVWLLPPTLTLQYHFMPKSAFSPYIGAGLNYTFFYGEDKGGDPAVTSVKYEDSLGYALQAGFDYQLDNNWSLNFDVKKIFLETDVKVNGGAINARDAKIDPWIFGVGIGYRF